MWAVEKEGFLCLGSGHGIADHHLSFVRTTSFSVMMKYALLRRDCVGCNRYGRPLGKRFSLFGLTLLPNRKEVFYGNADGEFAFVSLGVLGSARWTRLEPHV